jgi:hypothetical protein
MLTVGLGLPESCTTGREVTVIHHAASLISCLHSSGYLRVAGVPSGERGRRLPDHHRPVSRRHSGKLS